VIGEKSARFLHWRSVSPRYNQPRSGDRLYLRAARARARARLSIAPRGASGCSPPIGQWLRASCALCKFGKEKRVSMWLIRRQR
jgi:hypothetical protein